MNVVNCYHPKRIINPYSGQEQVVRCGKCNACRNERAAHWVTRCDMESASHKYTWFVNLSYDDFNVPQIVRLRKDDSDHIVYIDPSTGELFDTYDIHEQFTKKDIEYCKNSKVLNILHKRDFQLFIKRLRYYFHEIDKNAFLRYYITGEYGPRTYRCHAHCLIWFDSERCNEQFESLLHKAWTFGNIYEPHPVTGSAAQYVASYINSSSSLPKIYLHKGICPFSLKSSCPAIGTLYPLLESQQDIISRGDNTLRRFNAKTNSFEDVPFWRSLESRLYPRCQRFGSLSHDDRVKLYRKISEDFGKYDHLTAVQIAQRLKWEYLDTHREDFFGRYFFEISHKYVYKYRLTHQGADVPDCMNNLPFLPLDVVFTRPFTGIKDLSREFCFDSLVRFVRATSRLIHQASQMNISIEDYITKIENYYEKKEKLKLRFDYNFQVEYFKTHPKWHWLYFDKAFYDRVYNKDLNLMLLNDYVAAQYLMDFFNVKSLDALPYRLVKKDVVNKVFNPDIFCFENRHQLDIVPVLDIPPLEELDDYRQLKLLHDKIAHELVKQKANNDYAKLHRDRFGNVLAYQNL